MAEEPQFNNTELHDYDVTYKYLYGKVAGTTAVKHYTGITEEKLSEYVNDYCHYHQAEFVDVAIVK